jgi:hypothetical protein
LANINGQAFTGKQIEDRQRAESPAIGQLIRDEVHA